MLKVIVKNVELKCVRLLNKMPTYQSFNEKIGAWVKYKFGKNGFKPLDVKQKEPLVPFKNIKKKGKGRTK